MNMKPIRVLPIALLALGVLLFPQSGAFAQNEHPPEAAAPLHGDAAAAPDHGEEHAGGGGIMSVEPGLSIWTVITFLVLVSILGKTAWPPLMKSLVDRENHIREMVEGAEKAKEEAQRLLAHYRQQLENAKAEARAILEEGKQDAEKVKETLLADARAESERIRDRASREIELAKDKALKELQDEVVVLSTEIASKVLRKELKADDHRELIQTYIREYSQSAN